MNGYVCFYQGMRIEVKADSSYGAQLIAEKEFQKKNPRKRVQRHNISVVLAEIDGKEVTHNPLM